jgi:lamin B
MSSQKLSPSLGLLLEKEGGLTDSQPIYANVPKSTKGLNNRSNDQVAKEITQIPKEHIVHVELQKEGHEHGSVKDTVRGILQSSNFGNIFKFEKSDYPEEQVKEEKEMIPDNVKKTISRGGSRRASTSRVHDVLSESNPKSQFRPRASSGARSMTRREEKSALEGLNNRLAGYIDRVRTLQNKNRTLYHQIRTCEEYKQVEIDDVKELYEKQVEELQNALENATTSYNGLQSNAEGILNENRTLKDKVRQVDLQLSNSMDQENTLKEELWNFGNKISRTEYEHRANQNQIRDFLPELKSLNDRIVNANDSLDKEQLKSTDLETKCQHLEEQLKIKMSLLERELVDVKYKRETEINTIDGAIQDEYEDRLQKELQNLRDMYDNKMQENRDYFEERYQTRYRELQSQLTKKHGSTAGSTQELKESRYRIEALHRKISELERENLALNQKIADMAQEMKDQPSNHNVQVSVKDSEIERLIHELSDQMTEYRNLHEMKIALDMEIAVFRQLLDTEEDRLDEIHDMNHGDNQEPITIERRTTVRNSERRMVTQNEGANETQQQPYLRN